MTLSFQSAALWNPRPVWEKLWGHEVGAYCNTPLLVQALRDLAPANSLAALITDLPGVVSTLEAAMLREARAAADQVITGLRQRDPALGQAGAARLAGLGAGLTPAGDDWLVGGLLAIWARGPENAALADTIARAAMPRTTPFSASLIRAAARGECSPHWHTLLDSLTAGDTAALYAAAGAIIQQGHTSGADALAGWIMALSALI
jgi:hypothetical protein